VSDRPPALAASALPEHEQMTALERVARRRRGQLTGLAKARAARAALLARLRSGRETGWHVRPDERLDAFQAGAAATALERQGWRAEAFLASRGHGLRGRVPSPPAGVSR
jgi:hypothetical protein